MLILVAKCELKEGKKKEFQEFVAELIEKSNQEEGMIEYDLYEDVKNDNVVTFIEYYKDQAALDFHNDTEYVKRKVPMFSEYTVNVDVNVYNKPE